MNMVQEKRDKKNVDDKAYWNKKEGRECVGSFNIDHRLRVYETSNEQ